MSNPSQPIAFDHTSGSTLTVADAELYYEFQGDPQGPPLVLLHGGMGALTDFNSLLPSLANFRLLGIDSRGHGRSPLGSARLTYQQIERDVVNILDHLGLDKVSLVGFSDGGIVAYRLAAGPLRHRITRLVTIGSSWNNQHAAEMDEIFCRITGASWREKFPEMAQSYDRWNPDADFDTFVAAAVAMWRDQEDSGHPGDNVERILCPTLACRGDEDHLVQLSWCADLADRIEEFFFLNLPFAGHVAYEDQREAFLACALPFLNGEHD